MKRFAFLVCAFAALLVVSVGCGGGSDVGGENMVAFNHAGDWAQTDSSPAVCGYPAGTETYRYQFAMTGNVLTVSEEGACEPSDHTTSGNTVIFPPETSTYGCPNGDPCTIKEVVTNSLTFTSDNSYTGQTTRDYTCESGNCNQQTQPIVPCQHIDTRLGTRCQGCFAGCTLSSLPQSTPPVRHRSLFGS